jgi:hypothetical protein
VLPHLDAAAIEQWALVAFNALVARDAQTLRQELPKLLKAVDAPLLDPLAPVRRPPTPPKPSPAVEPTPPPVAEEALSGADRPNRPALPTPSPAPEPTHTLEETALSGANSPNRYACHTSSEPARPTEGLLPPLEPTPSASLSGGNPGNSPSASASSPWHGSSDSSGGTPEPGDGGTGGVAPSSGRDSEQAGARAVSAGGCLGDGDVPCCSRDE